VHFDQFAADGQTQAGAACFARGGGIHLGEFLEDRFKLVHWNSDASVFYADQYTVFFITYITTGLFFKMLVIDTYYKDEIDKREACSMFVCSYVP
jgi:hypothetical protein